VIGLDTNILVRHIAQDDTKQSALASALIAGLSIESPGFITIVSLVELVWVMQSCYESTRAEMVLILDAIIRTREFLIENPDTVFKAIMRFSGSKADFADCLIERSATKAGCVRTVTFDKAAAKFSGMELLV
jgi:predicted nucleic-acid-binding protein